MGRLVQNSIVLVALMVCAGAPIARGQEPRRPLTKDNVIRLLKGDVPPERVVQLAREHGIDFALTPEAEKDLRDAGATDELLAELRELSPKPPAAPPVLEIQSSPGHAEVYVDDARQGQTSEEGHLKVPNLIPGSHRLRLTHDGYHDDERQVDLAAEQTANVTVNLEKLTPPSVTLIPETTTIEKGQSITLAWMSENATELDLEPGVGKVEPKGSRALTPPDSTSYTLTAKGPGGTVSATSRVTVRLPLPPHQPPPSPEFQVTHWHGPTANCVGTLTITSTSVEYAATTKNGHRFSIPLSNIRDVKLTGGIFRSAGQAMAGTMDFKIYLKQGGPMLFTAVKHSDVVNALQLAVARYSEGSTR